MNQIKRILGIFWIVIGIAAIALMIYSAATNINSAKGDIGKPIPWIIIIAVFTPVAIGLIIFGWYSLQGEYDGEIKT
jgi:heme/copper-type cytochrome/quinol oxidase subunit 2